MDNSAVAIGNPAAAEWVPVASLTAWDKNPKPHDAANLKEIARSIRRFDFGAPIVAWKSQQRVVAGHGRLEAARLLLAEDPGRLLATDAPGPGLVPVRWVEFASEQEAAAYALADNRLTEANPMDDGAVAAILASFDGPVDLPGYDEEALSALLAMNEPEAPDEPEGDLTPPEEPQSRVGEVYELGPHRLVCGDCRDAGVWEKIGKFDAYVTDPPYGISVVGASGKIGGSVIAKNKTYTPVIGDNTTFDAKFLFEKCKTGVVFGANYFPFSLPYPGQWIVWDKGRPEGTTFSDCELAWTSASGISIKAYRCVWNGMVREGESGERFHPTQKPLKLISEIINDLIAIDAIVADPFGGSGTTLIACAQTGRRCRMIELDPRYCDVIRRRYTRYAQEAGLDPGPGALP